MKGLTRSRMRWQTVRFYVIYTLVVLAVAAVIAFALIRFRGTLADYEAFRSKYVLRKVVSMVESGDFGAMLDKEGDVPYSGLRSEYIAYMAKQAEGKAIRTNPLLVPDAEGLSFHLYADDTLLYRVRLRRTGEVNRSGFETWGFAEAENYTIQYATYRVQAPQNSTVYANAKPVSKKLIVQTGIPSGFEDHLAGGIEVPTNVIYEMDTYFGEPMFMVTDWRGRPQPIRMEEDGTRVAEWIYDDEEIKADREKRVLDVAEVMARLTIFDVTKNTVLKYTVQKSNAYKSVRSFDTTWPFATFGHKFSHERTENYVMWSDTFFSCDVEFDFYVKYRREERTNPIRYTMYFQNTGKNWMLYDFELK